VLREKFGLSAANMPRLGGAIFAYLFHRIDQKRLIEIIREHDADKEEQILEAVRTNGYVLKHCKAYAWAFYKSRFEGRKPDELDYLVVRDDQKFMRQYREDPAFVKGLKEDAKFLRRLNLAHIDLAFPAYSMSDYQALIDGATTGPTIHAHMGRYISKRMTFLIRSYNVKREDLQNEMTASALRAIYMGFPEYESVLHLQNTAKTGIHNAGESLVTYYTSPSRQRLMTTTEGNYEARQVNTDQLTSLEAPPSYLDGARDSLEVLVNVGKNLRPEVQRFLLCCAGHYDKGFSEFLMANNADAVEEMAYSRYVGKVRKYFEFSERQVSRLFEMLRERLETGAIELT
jgi:hypothetical protein